MKKLMTIALSITLATQIIVASQVAASREGCVTLEGFGTDRLMQGVCFYTIPVELVNRNRELITYITVESGKEAERNIREGVRGSVVTNYANIQSVLIN
jgi:hypothetical protein